MIWFYLIPALWCGALVAVWFHYFGLLILSNLPFTLSVTLIPYAWLGVIVGVLVALGGSIRVAEEVLYHTKTKGNMDAVATFGGSFIAILFSILASPWEGWGATMFAALTIAWHCGLTLNSYLVDQTDTLAMSLLALIVLLMCLSGATWLTAWAGVL